jgi:hypothetical protein
MTEALAELFPLFTMRRVSSLNECVYASFDSERSKFYVLDTVSHFLLLHHCLSVEYSRQDNLLCTPSLAKSPAKPAVIKSTRQKTRQKQRASTLIKSAGPFDNTPYGLTYLSLFVRYQPRSTYYGLEGGPQVHTCYVLRR